ncbi:hypothetical protein GQ53DRAFT_817114 [Thozetella sp. PMI_491]|nr:hypothetical protein GQ53DRAFT_817114 [Thozetella sp. PMI_491]
MKFSQALTVPALLAVSIQACIRLHVRQVNNPIIGDGIGVQLWDNNDFYCKVSQNHAGASSDTHWIMDCPNGPYHIDLWDNGRAGRISHKVSDTDTWQADLHVQNRDVERECVIDSDNGCRVYATTYETCLNDGFGNCGEYSCGLCDFNDCPQ